MWYVWVLGIVRGDDDQQRAILDPDNQDEPTISYGPFAGEPDLSSVGTHMVLQTATVGPGGDLVDSGSMIDGHYASGPHWRVLLSAQQEPHGEVLPAATFADEYGAGA